VTLVDSHCHLDARQFDADREAVIARAVESGVTRMVNPGVDLPSSRMAVALALRQHKCIYAAVGIHPHEAKTLDVGALTELRKLAASPKVVAIGEIGLDYYRDLSPRDVQRRALESQLELAAELGLPVIIHDRDAHDDVSAILSDWRSTLVTRQSPSPAPRSSGGLGGSPLDTHPGVLHSYSGDVALAERALAMGFFIGVSGPVTYQNASRLRDVVRVVPVERLLVETDAPYLTPQPQRGTRNEPAYVRFVARAVADVWGLTPDQVAAQTSANARALFGWPDD
jgi:TatD DNase family protein